MRPTARLLAYTFAIVIAHAVPAIAKSPPGGVYARHALAVDATTGETLFAKNDHYVVPIASITKLMTALVVRERGADLDSVVTVTRKLRRGSGRTRLRVGERIRMGDLLHLSLMTSDNFATRELAANVGLDADAFVERMNERADEMGWDDTEFVEVTGLSDRNVSTVHEVAALLKAATADTVLATIMTKKRHAFAGPDGRAYAFGNTNRMLYDRYPVRGGKTGHIGNAGSCVATWLRAKDREMIIVILGSVNSPTRFNDVRRVIRRIRPPSREAG